jgi:hypothetical protein
MIFFNVYLLKMHNSFVQEYNIMSNVFVLFFRNVTNDRVQALTYIALRIGVLKDILAQ